MTDFFPLFSSVYAAVSVLLFTQKKNGKVENSSQNSWSLCVGQQRLKFTKPQKQGEPFIFNQHHCNV